MIFRETNNINDKMDLSYEGKTNLATFLSSQKGYEMKDNDIFYENELIGSIYGRKDFYTFLEQLDINWTALISEQIFPNDSIFVIIVNTVFIIECKSEHILDSAYEQLQTCDFKRKQYQKLLSGANIEVEYIYLLSDWFRKPQYKDILNYIHSVHCFYFFDYIPLAKLGLPIPKENSKQ